MPLPLQVTGNFGLEFATNKQSFTPKNKQFFRQNNQSRITNTNDNHKK